MTKIIHHRPIPWIAEIVFFPVTLFSALLHVVCSPFGRAFESTVSMLVIGGFFGLLLIPTCFVILCLYLVELLGICSASLFLRWIVLPFLALYFVHILMDKTHLVVENSGPIEARNFLEQAADSFTTSWQHDYFPEITCVAWSDDAILPPNQQYIFALHPHGIHCVALAEMQNKGSSFHQRFPGLFTPKLCGLAATVIFKIPAARELFFFWGYIDASRKCASEALEKGQSLYFVVGGEEESMYTTRGRDIIVLTKRKGFVRLALSHGVILVPVFSVGSTDMYQTYHVLHGLRMLLQKNLGVALPIFHGRWFTTLPYKAPIKVLIGQPIPTPIPKVRGAKPEEALVDEYHTKYTKALQELYAQHVKDRILEIR